MKNKKLLLLITIPLIIISLFTSGCTLEPNSYIVNIITWISREEGEYGINYDHEHNASNPSLTANPGLLYCSWQEFNGTAWQIRVARYSEIATKAVWIFIDGNTSNGINRDPSYSARNPDLQLHSNGLYAIWSEDDGTCDHIRISRYTTFWKSIDESAAAGINRNEINPATEPAITIHGDNIYAVWSEHNGTAWQIRAARCDSSLTDPTWTYLDSGAADGINKNPLQDARSPHIISDGFFVYATWEEETGMARQIRVAKIDDTTTDWTLIDKTVNNGINIDASHDARSPSLVIINSDLAANWSEKGESYYTPSGSTWNGTQWNDDVGIIQNNISDREYNMIFDQNCDNPVTVALNDTYGYLVWQQTNPDTAAVNIWYLDNTAKSTLNRDQFFDAKNIDTALNGTYQFVTWEENNNSARQIRVSSTKLVYND